MSRPSHVVEHELQRHGDALRALAGALVRDPNVADDAVQEVWLAALQRPPRHQSALGGWLATALHNAVRMWRRSERRRERREEIVRSARGGIDRGEAVAREERGRQLLTAVESLEQPFRDAIWQRFFEGKAPREIAAASGVPVATVKSRLQRGLAMLRARLGERDGSDWRAGFATAFGFGKEGATATAALATGGVVMATWTKVTGAIAAAAVVAFLCWPVAATPTPAAVTRADSGRATPAVADLGAQRANAPADAGAPDAQRVAATPAPATANAKLATIRGRCVDEQGNALAGCKVLLNGWRVNQERVDAWLRDHPQPDWKNPPAQVTAADGAFSFTFWPPPPFQFAIGVDRDDLAAIGARWNAIAEGRSIDLGDIVMVPGVRVQGRVVDDAGAPIANATVTVRLGPGELEGETETPSFETTSGSSTTDGSFRCRSPVRPGPYRVDAYAQDGLQLAKPFTGTLTRERPVEDLVLVLPRPANVPTITGRIVDEVGQPIRDASLEADDQDDGRTVSTNTRRDGTFTLKKTTASGGSVSLRASHPMFEPVRSDQTYAWGATDVVLTMRTAGGLAVYVRDEDGTAHTDFTVRAVRRDRRGHSSTDDDVRTRGPYAAGFAAVPGIQRGSWTLLVEFPTALQRASVAAPIEKTADDTLRVEVTARANTQRAIRIVDAKDEPVAGARVQVCLPVEGQFGGETYVSPMERLFGPGSNPPISRALLLMEGATGADGSLVVTGPQRQTLGICVRSAGCVPVHRGDVLLDGETPLVITVEKGARLLGALQPAAALATLQQLAGQERWELRLSRAARQLPLWFERGFPVAADGTFDCDGLEPGEWKVVMHAGSTFELGQVTLRSGESTRLDPYLAYLVPGTLQGTLHKNGAPLAGAEFTIGGEVPGPFAYANATTDAAGRFAVNVGSGAYRAWLSGRDRGGNELRWRSLERATVVAGQTTQQEFHVWTGVLKLTLRDARGAVLAGVRVRITRADAVSHIWLPPSEANGVIEGELTPESVALAVLPRRLQSARAQNELRQHAGGQGVDPVEACWISLGTATIVANQTMTLELRMPPEFEK